MVEISHLKKINFLFIHMWIFAFTHFLSHNFDLICNNKQLYFVKMHPTMSSDYFFVSNSISKFVKVTTTDKQLLKLGKTCCISINLSSVYVNPNFLCKKKDSYIWFQTAAIVWFLSLTLSKTKVLCRYLRIFYIFFINFWEIDDCKDCFIYIFIE